MGAVAMVVVPRLPAGSAIALANLGRESVSKRVLRVLQVVVIGDDPGVDELDVDIS